MFMLWQYKWYALDHLAKIPGNIPVLYSNKTFSKQRLNYTGGNYSQKVQHDILVVLLYTNFNTLTLPELHNYLILKFVHKMYLSSK